MFNRLGFRCMACGKELTGGLDTYGDYNQPMCQEHYFGLSEWACPWCGSALTFEELAWNMCACCGAPVLEDDEPSDPWIIDYEKAE